MGKDLFQAQRFCLRKLKLGLASVAILLAFAQVGRVAADETTATSLPQPVLV